MRYLRAGCCAAVLMCVSIACACGSESNSSPTTTPIPNTTIAPALTAIPTITVTGLSVPGFEIVLSPGQKQEMVMKPIPPVFEDDPAAVSFAVSHTQEGDMSVGSMAKAIGNSFPVRDLYCCRLGSKFGFALRDSSGSYVAIRAAAERAGPGLPSWEALEGVRASAAEPVLIKAPTQTFTDIDGITYYPPESVQVLDHEGVYLEQEANGDATGVAVNTVVWREGDFYWRVTGVAPSSRGYLDRTTLLSVVTDYLIQYDPSIGDWRPVDIPGVELSLSPGQADEMVMGPIPPVFEDDPSAVAFSITPTPGSPVVSDTVATTLGDTLIVRSVLYQGLGRWSVYGLQDVSGRYVAFRVSDERLGPGLPATLALESVRASVAEPVLIKGPTDPFTDADGISYFPPERVRIRDYEAVYLQQEAKAGASGLAVNTLVWLEDDFYWRVMGLAPSSGGTYDRERLLEVAQSLLEHDPATGQWIPLGSS